ncbi:hypothetical protein CR513_15965 [Mucuna pruriens]|uniref:Uncharacterized protein n=1 Tax=Mucuna pruriens TaxID=157652 RepID=A0A371HDD2_MUCPR|nr:hypothetical protein CR513_15965 [Mucuna pruriens]
MRRSCTFLSNKILNHMLLMLLELTKMLTRSLKMTF